MSFKTAINQSENNDLLYVGYEKIGILDEGNPEMIWFHQTFIKIKTDSVFIEQVPINIYKKDTLYSSSDGGFYYFKGIINEYKDEAKISVKEIRCDYCGTEIKKNLTELLKE